ETRRNALAYSASKIGRILKELVIAPWRRKKIILTKLFSPTARMRAEFYLNRELPSSGVPVKEDWFSYWLDTGFAYPDQSLVVSKKVFMECAPRYVLGQRTVGNMPEFFYQFNSRGYLSYFVPVYATFGRVHAGQSGD